MTVFTATEATLPEQQSVGLVKAQQHLQLGNTWNEKAFFLSLFMFKKKRKKNIVFSSGLDLWTVEHKTHRGTSCN